jgi:hypothetical protein
MRRKIKCIPGVLWIYDKGFQHEIFINWEMYENLMNIALPFGWAIIAAPRKIMEESGSSHNKCKLPFLQKLWKLIVGKNSSCA